MDADTSVIPIAAYLGSWFATLGVVYRISNQIDTVASEELKRFTSHYLQKSDPSSLFTGGFYSIDRVFDVVFGVEHFSRKRVRRSAFATIISFFLIMLVSIFYYRKPLYSILHDDDIHLTFVGPSHALLQLLIYLSINIIIDFFSLLETRLVLRAIMSSKSKVQIFFFISLDLILSYSIFIAFYTLFFVVTSDYLTYYDSLSLTTRLFTETLTSLFTLDNMIVDEILNFPLESAIVFSTFLTSVWIYFHLLSSAILRLKTPTITGLHFFKRAINIKEKPFLSIGVVINVLISIGFLIGLFFVILF